METVSTSFEPETLWNEQFKYLAQSKFILVCLLSYAFVQIENNKGILSFFYLNISTAHICSVFMHI